MNWRPWAVVGAVLLAMSVCYFVGKKQGVMDEKLSSNKIQIHASDSTTKSVEHKVDSAKKSSDILTTYRERVRERIVVRHDTIEVDGNEVIDKEAATLIQVDDSTISALKNTVALQDTLIASLRVGLNLRDERISLLEDRRSPRFGIKSGIAIGAVSTVAIVVVAVKVIQALRR